MDLKSEQGLVNLAGFLNTRYGFPAEPAGFREALLAAVAGDWAALEPFAQKCSLRVEIRDSGPVLKARDESGPCVVVAPMLVIVYEAIATGAWPRLKICRNPDCRTAFLDRSKNASAAWCSMASCGNRMKARRRRQKAAAHRLDSGS